MSKPPITTVSPGAPLSAGRFLLRPRKLIGIALAILATALSSHKAYAQFAEKKVLTLAAAQKMIAAAQAEAEHNHLAGVIAVVDDGGWPILVLRMDNAALVSSVGPAPGKARTAALFKTAERGTGGCHQSRPDRGCHRA
jgi:hypothetical protein